MCVNKKLFDEKLCLQNHLKAKNDEITDLTNKIANLNKKNVIVKNIFSEINPNYFEYEILLKEH